MNNFVGRACYLVLFCGACVVRPSVRREVSPTREPEGPVALAHRWVDGQSGASLSADELANRLRQVKIVYIGEHHSNPADHGAEVALFELLIGLEPSTGLGLEMLPRTTGREVADYLAGALDEAAFLSAVDWAHTWGFPFGFYRPLFELARAKGLPIYPLNAPRTLTRAVAERGTEALPPELKAMLPELHPGPAAHRALVREAFSAHGGHGRPQGHDQAHVDFENFYAAQLVWDETMAEEVARVVGLADAPARLLVVAGATHTRSFSIPERAARRGAGPYLTVRPVMESELNEALSGKVADVLWVMMSPAR